MCSCVCMQVKLQEAPLRKGKIVRDEDRATGKVKLHHYYNYLSAWGPYFIVPGLLLAGYIGQQGSVVCPPAHFSETCRATTEHL